MFVPVKLSVGAGGREESLYHRGFDLVGERLMAFELHSKDMSEPLGTIGGALRDLVAGQFTSQGGTGATGKWATLSEPYGTWKQEKVPGVPTLIGITRTGAKGQRPQTYKRSGRMLKALLDPLSTHVGPTRLLYAPVSDYAGYHETGTGDMPARPPVDPRLSDLRVFDRVFTAWVAKITKESGL